MRNGYYRPRSIRRSERKSRRNIILRLIVALVLVYVLLVWGLPALINSLQIFNKLKAQNNQTTQKNDQIPLAPPVLNIPFEATNSSQLNITGFVSPNAKVQIYLDDELKTETKALDDGSFSSDPIELSLGTNNIYGMTLDNNDNKSLASKTIRVIYDDEKPKLEISSPKDGQDLKGDKKLIVSGKTDPNNSVTVNGTTVIIDGNGDFSVNIDLNDGRNTITIVATNSVGNITKIERNVTFTPPTPTPSPSPSPPPTPTGQSPSPTP